MEDEEIKKYLEVTEYIDYNSQIVQKVKEKIAQNDADKEKFAVKAFYYIRNNFPYTFGSWNKPASEVFLSDYGMCTNKAVALVALLRSFGIPSGFGMFRVSGKEYFGPIVPAILKRRIASFSVHYYVGIYLDGKWLKIDPSADPILCEKTSYFNPTTEIVEWDGEHDAMEKIDAKYIHQDTFPIANIDKLLQKKPKNAKGIGLKVGNLYLNFLRQNEVHIYNPDRDLDVLFKKWLRRKYFFYYILFIFISTAKDIDKIILKK